MRETRRIWEGDRSTYHGRHLARNDLLLHLLRQRVLQGEVVPPIDEQLVLEVLGRVEVLARWLLPVTPTLRRGAVQSSESIIRH